MDVFFEQLKSVTWWVSVGIAGVILSMLGNYIVRLLDISFLKSIEFVKFLNYKVNQRVAEINELEKSQSQELSKDLHEQIIVSFIIIRIEMRLLLIGISTILIVLGQYIYTENNNYQNEIFSILLIVCFGASLFEFVKLRRWSRILANGFKQYKE